MFDNKFNKPIRVLFVDHTAQLGGGEIALRNLLQHLRPDRVHAEVLLCADGPLVEQLKGQHTVRISPLASQIANMRKSALGWKTFLNLGSLLLLPGYIRQMSREIKRANVDIVHTNSLKAHVLGGLAARLAGRVVIWHLRDRIAPDYLPSGAVRFIRVLSKILPHFIIANSHATLSTIVSSNSKMRTRTRCRYQVVHDGCEVSSEPLLPKPNATVKIGLIGRISPWKGQHVFIEAAAKISTEFRDVRFQIIGAPLFSETEYEAEIRALARRLAIEDQLEFVGFVADVQSAIAELSVVVHASTVGEPFGQVVIEGMAAGKPVIATNGGGIPEIVVDNVTGLLVPMNDEHAMADAMTRLLRDPAEADAMGRRGRDRVRRLFTIDRTAHSVEQVYQQVMSMDIPQFDTLEAAMSKRLDP